MLLSQGLTWSVGVENWLSNAGDSGSVSDWGTMIPCAMVRLSLQATAAEPVCRNQYATQPKTIFMYVCFVVMKLYLLK